MAIQGGLRLDHAAVFPNGAYVVGEVTAVEDYEAVKAARESGKPADTQARDLTTGLRLWQVRVIDADERARRGQVEVVVKVAAEHQPVPPERVDGVPFRPVEFDDLTGIPYIDESKSRPRIAWSLRASGMHAPGSRVRAAQKASLGEGKVA